MISTYIGSFPIFVLSYDNDYQKSNYQKVEIILKQNLCSLLVLEENCKLLLYVTDRVSLDTKPWISCWCTIFYYIFYLHYLGSRDGVVVIALAYHLRGPGSDHKWVKLVVGPLLGSERFFSGFSSFRLPSKINISKFQVDRRQDFHENHFRVSGPS